MNIGYDPNPDWEHDDAVDDALLGMSAEQWARQVAQESARMESRLRLHAEKLRREGKVGRIPECAL